MKPRYETWLFPALCMAAVSLLLTGCPKTFPDCGDDGDCAAYERGADVCIDGICRECRTDSNCDRGFQCRNNSCVSIPGFCESDNSCPDGQICENNRCRAGCNENRPCSAGLRCENNSCVDDRECTLDNDCGAGNCCVEYACVVCSPCHNRQFDTIYFDFDESTVRADQETGLNNNLECLNTYPEDQVRIEGHCDERGTDAYNLALGERRARAIKRQLERMGADDDQLSTISYGESRPAATCSSESCWRQNRRSEFTWR